MPIFITLKRRKDGGYYVDNKIPLMRNQQVFRPEEIVQRVGAVNPDIVIPLDTSRPLLFKNIDGKMFCATIDPDNHMILTITQQSTGIEVDEVEIDQESHFWYFTSGIPAEEMLSKTPKQT